jgi:hypothetical protein
VTLRDALEEVRAAYGYLSPETVVRAARVAGYGRGEAAA